MTVLCRRAALNSYQLSSLTQLLDLLGLEYTFNNTLALSFIHNSLHNSFAKNSEGRGNDIKHGLYCSVKLKCKVFNCV